MTALCVNDGSSVWAMDGNNSWEIMNCDVERLFRAASPYAIECGRQHRNLLDEE
jgi:hypothetical protein